jgi:N-acetylmuramoyl-L-alanine amidase
VLGLLLALTAGAAVTLVTVEVSTASGVRLGRLVGESQAGVTYYLLNDVARLANARMRRNSRGDRMTLTSRRAVVEVTRDSRRVTIDGRVGTLAAPVRVRQGTWRVPSDLLPKVLPTLTGTGVRVALAEVRARRRPTRLSHARPGPRRRRGRCAGGGRARRPAPARLPRRLPHPPAPSASPRPRGGTRRAGARAPAPPAAPSAARVELRVRSYPTYTRLVLEADAPIEPRLVETEGGLTVTFPDVSPRGWAGTRTVRDGLVATTDLGESRGAAALRVAFERPPAARKVFRLEDPPRVVLDFHRQAGAPPASGAGPEPLQTIMIDPGHGGHDAGAMGPSGLQEKELTLDIARRVAALLQEELGVRVVLTRGKDQFIGLRERTALANGSARTLFPRSTSTPRPTAPRRAPRPTSSPTRRRTAPRGARRSTRTA